ncbi:RDD family protein [Sinosporangium siamense]|uniref:RDD domain-containing protein n=1 Tax=Sinosporangium siamense TaxID=1367973 RepID=A0A919RBT3_9ACTN|nr:RDD family protein [Sinosporangium siamense]GII91041.1 hypothetical protein Ssi02_12720 [Sinosporangium siamense]
MTDVVTGEAVVVEVRLAQLPTRALSIFIDAVIQLAFMVTVILLVANASVITDGAMSSAMLLLFIVLVIVGYPTAFESLTRGRTPGKMALGLRVVSEDGSPERFRQALFRALAGVVEFWLLLGAPALITSLISAKGKRLGDIFSGTAVISERGPRAQEPTLEIPASLAAWAATLELSRLSVELAGTARQYLARLDHLAPAVGHEMGNRIAAQVAAVVSPPPPPGVPAWVYLSAVLAERRNRDHARLAGRLSGAGQQAHAPQAAPWQSAPPSPNPNPSPWGHPDAGHAAMATHTGGAVPGAVQPYAQPDAAQHYAYPGGAVPGTAQSHPHPGAAAQPYAQPGAVQPQAQPGAWGHPGGHGQAPPSAASGQPGGAVPGAVAPEGRSASDPTPGGFVLPS